MFYDPVYGTSQYLFCMYLHGVQSISDFFFFFGESDLGFPLAETNRRKKQQNEKPVFRWTPAAYTYKA